MSESLTDTAFARIDSALARIETQTALLASGAWSSETELADLRQRHENLRTAVGGNLSELDALIAEMEQ